MSLRLEAIPQPDGRLLSPCGRYYFDRAAADRATDFFPECLQHFRGALAGQKFQLLTWQADLVVRPLFGWKRVEDGRRRFRTLFLFIPKKNGKSMIASGLGLFLLGADGEEGAQVFSVAKDRPQGRIVFGDAALLAENSPVLMKVYDVYKTSIVFLRRRSSYQVLAGKVSGNHGWNIHGLLFDEFHEQEDAELFDTLRFGSIARQQPIHALISTAGNNSETPCYVEYEKAKELIAGKAEDDRYLPVVFEAPKEADWTLEATWRAANPSLGHTISVEDMRAAAVEAQRMPSKRNAFLQLLLNRWGETRQSWITPERWDACKAATPWENLRDSVCCLGVDLSSTMDLTCVAAVFRRPHVGPAKTMSLSTVLNPDDIEADAAELLLDFDVYLRVWFFIPRETMRERIERDHVRYDRWAEEGHVRVCEGSRIDYRLIRRVIVNEIKRDFPHLREVAVDPWNATQFNQQMMGDGVPVVEVRQGYPTLSAPSKLLEGLVADRMIYHDGNPCMRWCVENTEIAMDANENIRPVKSKKRWRRIDGVAAAVTALSRLMVIPPAEASVYDEGGIRSL